MNNPFLLFCCPKPWRQIWIWYIELVYSRIISFPRGKPSTEIRVLDDSTSTVRNYLQRANEKMRFISERNKWFYAGCDGSILYFSNYQQRRVSCPPGGCHQRVIYVTGHVSHGSEAKGLLPALHNVQSKISHNGFVIILCPSKQSSSKARLLQHQ